MVVGFSHDVIHSPLLWLLIMVASLHLMYSSVEVVNGGLVAIAVVVVDGSLLVVARFVVVWGYTTMAANMEVYDDVVWLLWWLWWWW